MSRTKSVSRHDKTAKRSGLTPPLRSSSERRQQTDGKETADSKKDEMATTRSTMTPIRRGE
jgi:hypothetical protein